jgi:hypothetical protein
MFNENFSLFHLDDFELIVNVKKFHVVVNVAKHYLISRDLHKKFYELK